MRGFEETNEVKVARFSKTEYHSIYSMYRYVRYSTYSRTGVVDEDTWLFLVLLSLLATVPDLTRWRVRCIHSPRLDKTHPSRVDRLAHIYIYIYILEYYQRYGAYIAVYHSALH